MYAGITAQRRGVAAICRRYGVRRLEVFGSAARGVDFDPERSDADFLVTFRPDTRDSLSAFSDLKAALEILFGRRVDLVEREAVEASRNHIRRRHILSEAQVIYG